MRLGFFIGFLIGAAIASVLSLAEQDEPGSLDDGSTLDHLKRQAREARDAAREAAEEKEREMMQDWEAARHRSP